MRVGLRCLSVLALLLVACPGCRHDFRLEARETRVNVWLTAPDLAAAGGTVDALIYVGPYKVVEGPVVFPQGVPTVNLPPLFIRAGPRDVSAVLEGGRVEARDTVAIEGESWIQVVLRGGQASIRHEERQPDPWGR